MAWAVEERSTTATMRRVPLQRGQQRTSVRNVRLRSWAQGMGRRGGWEDYGYGDETAVPDRAEAERAVRTITALFAVA
jgi:hypothetical protein